MTTEKEEPEPAEKEQPAGDEQNPSSLPEYNKVMEQVDNKDYRFQTVTDNRGKRILLLIDPNGNKRYKTIFIKEMNRLKIIQIPGGQIFNNVLDK